MDTNKTLLTILVVFVLLAAVGFYMAFDKIAALSTTVSNLELSNQLKAKESAPAAASPENTVPAPAATSSSPASTQAQAVSTVASAILFETLSDVSLKPQATTTVTVESVAKMSDGSIQVAVKAFTSNASSYTALDPKSVLTLIDTDGNTTPATQVKGSFSSMPPKSSTEGILIFTPSTDRNSVILQIGSGDDIKFYEFDFLKKNYKETVIG